MSHIHFGQRHDSKEEEKTILQIPENIVGIMDRGCSSKEKIKNLLKINGNFFVTRVFGESNKGDRQSIKQILITKDR